MITCVLYIHCQVNTETSQACKYSILLIRLPHLHLTKNQKFAMNVLLYFRHFEEQQICKSKRFEFIYVRMRSQQRKSPHGTAKICLPLVVIIIRILICIPFDYASCSIQIRGHIGIPHIAGSIQSFCN